MYWVIFDAARHEWCEDEVSIYEIESNRTWVHEVHKQTSEHVHQLVAPTKRDDHLPAHFITRNEPIRVREVRELSVIISGDVPRGRTGSRFGLGQDVSSSMSHKYILVHPSHYISTQRLTPCLTHPRKRLRHTIPPINSSLSRLYECIVLCPPWSTDYPKQDQKSVKSGSSLVHDNLFVDRRKC